jgi:transposase
MTRRYGRAAKGERVVGQVPQGRWHVTTMIGAIRINGPTAGLVFEGATDTEAFATFVERVLRRQLRPGDVVIMDNLSSHKSTRVQHAIDQAGARLRYLPPYSPDLNPIEKMWSKVKALLRKAEPRTVARLWGAVSDAWHKVTASDCKGFFASCGIPTVATST